MISVPALVITLLCLAGCVLIGDLLLPRRAVQAWARVALGFALGTGVVSLIIFAAGAVRIWSTNLFLGTVVVLAVLGLAYPLRWMSYRLGIPRPRLSEAAAIVLVVVLLVITLAGASAPVTDWDGVSYHLPVLQMYLNHGGFYWIPFIHHSNFPFGAEMLFAPAVALEVFPAAKVVHWAFFAMAVFGVGSLGSRIAGRGAGPWAALAFALVPVALWEATAAYVDLATAAYVVLSALCLVSFLDEDQQEQGRVWLVLAAVMAGFAAGTKTFALVWVALGFLWLLAATRSKNVQVSAKFLIVSLVICAPWYIKSLIMTGNPVFPFLYSILGGRGWDEAGAEMYRLSFTKFGMGRGIGDYLMLPWNLMANGGRFIDGGIIFGSAGPAFAALLPAALIRARERAVQLALAAGVFITIWFALTQQTRYLLPVLALWAAVMSVPAVGSSLLASASRGALLLAGAASVYLAAVGVSPVFSLMRGDVTVDNYILQAVNSYWVGRYLPPDEKILLYGETRGLYLPQKYLWADEGLNTVIPYAQFDGPRKMIDWMKENGWTVALINRKFAASESRPILLWDEAISQGIVEPYGGSDFTNPQAMDVELWRIP